MFKVSIPYRVFAQTMQDFSCDINGDGNHLIGRDVVCDGTYLSDKVDKKWYGYDVVGNITTYEVTPPPGVCRCSYRIYICEPREDLECLGTDAPYQSQSELCATSSSSADAFVGGTDLDILTYPNAANIDLTADTCACSYSGDNCLNDTKKRDTFDAIGNFVDNDPCTNNFIQDCCQGSELSFGGTAISSLDLTTYVNLKKDDNNAWGCLSGNAFCDADNVPDLTDNKVSYFSWVYNEFDSGNIGFQANTICQCLITYNNCTTANPTADTSAPTLTPSTPPSSSPTLSPTHYQYDDFDETTVHQPCCGDASAALNGDQCAADSSPLSVVFVDIAYNFILAQ